MLKTRRQALLDNVPPGWPGWHTLVPRGVNMGGLYIRGKLIALAEVPRLDWWPEDYVARRIAALEAELAPISSEALSSMPDADVLRTDPGLSGFFEMCYEWRVSLEVLSP